MTLLVTGGSGLIGREILTRYAPERPITALSRGPVADQVPGVRYAECDYTVEGLTRILRDRKIDAVFHLAAERPLPSPTSREGFLDSVLVTENLLEACRIVGVTSVVFASSRSVYSEHDLMPWREDTPPRPISTYGMSKLASERICGRYAMAHGLSVKCLRIAQVLSKDEREGYLVRTLIDNARAGTRQAIYGTGAGRREYVYISDVADAFMKAAECPDISGEFNIGVGATTSIAELARIANSAFGSSAGIEYRLEEPEDLSVSVMDVTKAERDLGFVARFSVESAMEDMARKLRSH